VITEELAAFLRSRRERLNPTELGLPLRRSRRTPGLRREEVAELAGVSVDYVVRLEQGRGLRPSADVVEALARALRLPPIERDYLFDLAGRRRLASDAPSTAAAPDLEGLVTDLSLPAMLLNHRFDVLAWNPAMARLLVDFAALPPTRRNAVWVCLAHPAVRDRYADRDGVVRDGVAHLRTAWAAHPDDPALTSLIDELRAADDDVARLWAEGEVTVNGRGRKPLRHPDLGEIAVRFEILAPLPDPEQRLVVFRGADDPSRKALATLNV
jgi:transcriptional regulator with XRE-family HTH domain